MMAGYLYPRKLAWLIFSVAPILGPLRFTPIPSDILPLNIDRIAFFMTLGILLRYANRGFPFRKIFESKVILLALAFSFIYIIVAFNEKTTFFTYIPNMFYSFMLPFIIIRDQKDLTKLCQIFFIHTAIIATFIYIEYFTHINFGLLLQKTNPTVSEAKLYTDDLYVAMSKARGGQLRIAGLYGHPINTGFRMAFLIPIALWYSMKKEIIFKILFGFIFLHSFYFKLEWLSLLSFYHYL